MGIESGRSDTKGIVKAHYDDDGDQYVNVIDASGNELEIVNGAVKVSQGALDKDTDSVTSYDASPSEIGDGNKTVTAAGTAVKLSTDTISCKIVVITALLSNTGLISVGGSTTTPSGTIRGDILAAGDSTVVSIDDISKVYINSTVNSEGVSFRYQN